MTRILLASIALGVCLAAPARAADGHVPASLFPASSHDVWHVCFLRPCSDTPLTVRGTRPVRSAISAAATDLAAPQRRRPVIIEYSHGYQVRRRIHKVASFATLPLFGAELLLGHSLYTNTPTDRDSRRLAHAIVGASIVGLFGVNTVTGAWNLLGQGRKDPHGRTLRMVHGALMLLADAGFAATVLSGPNSRRPSEAFTYEADKAHHANLALASIGVATAGYLLMIFGNR